MRTRLTPALVLLAAVTPAAGQEKKPADKKDPPPKVLYAVPLVAKPGQTQRLTLRGQRLDAATGLAVAGADGAVVTVRKAGKATVPNNHPPERVGDTELEVELTLPKDVRPGAVTLTAAGPGGASNAYPLLVRDATPAVAEVEDNDRLVADGDNKPQAVTLPCAVEGTVKGDRDVDVFTFTGKAGGRVEIDVQAARFGSPLDAFIAVYDADRRTVALADDGRLPDGKPTPDPTVVVTLPRDGAYFVVLTDAHDLGGPMYGYRLVVRTPDR